MYETFKGLETTSNKIHTFRGDVYKYLCIALYFNIIGKLNYDNTHNGLHSKIWKITVKILQIHQVNILSKLKQNASKRDTDSTSTYNLLVIKLPFVLKRF